MKIVWYDGSLPVPSGAEPPRRQVAADSLKVGCRSGEFYIQIGGITIIIPPQTALQLAHDLQLQLGDSARQRALPGSPPRRSRDTVAKQVLRSLFKSHKVSKNLIAVNTRRRTHPHPDDAHSKKE